MVDLNVTVEYETLKLEDDDDSSSALRCTTTSGNNVIRTYMHCRCAYTHI